MKKGRAASFAFCLFVALEMSGFSISSAEEALPPKLKQENCNYTVAIETTCAKGAETSNVVSLRFGDIQSNDVLVRHLNSKHVRRVDPLYPAVLDEVPRKPFEACTVDEFRVTGPCVQSPICYLYLKSVGGDSWRPGLAQVRVSSATPSHLSSDYFYFRRYLPKHVWHGFDTCDKEVTPFGIKYHRKVFGVGDKKHA
ncbi:PREDICTED: uncharacterized protein LOC104594702 isoform X1 [Nelumbo nucifera]|nr:PREDICTED: uncharacterized protein LOC104594702 isoform X1 [Nelumbo nucifera]